MFPTQPLTHAQIELRNKQILRYAGYAFGLILTVCLFMIPEAHAAGLSKPKSMLEKFTTEILPIVRLLAIIALIGAGAGYMMNMVDKSIFFKIIVGIIIVVGASEFVNYIWG